MIRYDISNRKPVLRRAESISEETLFLKTYYMLAMTAVIMHAAPLELTAVYKLSRVALMAYADPFGSFPAGCSVQGR